MIASAKRLSLPSSWSYHSSNSYWERKIVEENIAERKTENKMLENIRFIIGIIILVLYFGIVPSVIGIGGSSILCPKRKVSVTEAYIWGNIILWLIFQVLCVPMGIVGIRFTVLTITFLAIILVLLICILILQKKRILERIRIAFSGVKNFS